jgi:hypothetical protein
MLRLRQMTRRRLFPFFVAAIALLAPACGGAMPVTSTQPARLGIEGAWRGTLRQEGLAPFVVTATIRAPGASRPSTVHYTGIDCSGTWTYLGRTGPAYRFREVIDRGAGGKCKGVGAVSLVPEGVDRLRYEFRGGGVVSRGIISRVRR